MTYKILKLEKLLKIKLKNKIAVALDVKDGLIA